MMMMMKTALVESLTFGVGALLRYLQVQIVHKTRCEPRSYQRSPSYDGVDTQRLLHNEDERIPLHIKYVV